jgi:hypothetical protein
MQDKEMNRMEFKTFLNSLCLCLFAFQIFEGINSYVFRRQTCMNLPGREM